MWSSRIFDLSPLELDKLPDFGFQFFFKNQKGFKLLFWSLTGCAVVSTLISFSTVFLLGEVVTRINELSISTILSFYLPLWLLAMLISEALDYFTRKYAETLPAVYCDTVSFGFYRTFLGLRLNRLGNFSKERLALLVSRYVGTVRGFLSDWFWGTTPKIVKAIVVFGILAWQSPVVLAFNLAYIVLFLWLALGISARFSAIARRYAEQSLDTGSVMSSMALQLNTLKRLGLQEFYSELSRKLLFASWDRLAEMQTFHAKRWLVQLNLFNFLYIGTLFYGVVQVKAGTLPLGFLVLIKWAFDQLWFILVYIIEYFVSLIQQREDARIVRAELGTILHTPKDQPSGRANFQDWSSLELKDILVEFGSADASNQTIQVKVPHFVLKPGDKVGIIGPSGAGKSTIFNVLLNLIDYRGSYRLSNQEIRGQEIAASDITVITSSEPLFKISLRDNILLGRSIHSDKLAEIMTGVGAAQFISKLDTLVGSPDFSLSSGEEQRIRLARGLVQDSSIYLLDEPFNGIDVATRTKILAFLGQHLADKTVILVTHNEAELSLVNQVHEIYNSVLRPRGKGFAKTF